MFIWKDTLKRCNPYNVYIDEHGTTFPQVPKDLYMEIPDPVRGDDNLFYNQEIDDAPYLLVVPRPQDQVDAYHARVAKELADQTDAADVRADAKFQALISKTPAQAKNWVQNNFPTLTAPEQKDLATIVMAIGILARKL